ncbi:MAG: hypothetical protein ACFB9N_07090 [Geitlerinemataceae cyanobacterium]
MSLANLRQLFPTFFSLTLAASLASAALGTQLLDGAGEIEIARRRTAYELIERGERLAIRGEVTAAVVALQEADTMTSLWGVSANSWNVLCWYGSLWNQAEAVLEACHRAVELEPENIEILDSRGLARALTGDIGGAIADFSEFVEQTSDENRRYQRQNWVNMLEAGEQPFTEDVLQMLFID